MPKSRDQERAVFAYRAVSDANKKLVRREYRSLLRSFPIMILTNGYGTAMSFLFSKKTKETKESAQKELYMTIQAWLRCCNFMGEDQDLMEAILDQEKDGYKILANESLALLGWLKRFAEGMIDVERE